MSKTLHQMLAVCHRRRRRCCCGVIKRLYVTRYRNGSGTTHTHTHRASPLQTISNSGGVSSGGCSSSVTQTNKHSHKNYTAPLVRDTLPLGCSGSLARSLAETCHLACLLARSLVRLIVCASKPVIWSVVCVLVRRLCALQACRICCGCTRARARWRQWLRIVACLIKSAYLLLASLDWVCTLKLGVMCVCVHARHYFNVVARNMIFTCFIRLLACINARA